MGEQVLFEGDALKCLRIEGDIAEIIFDLKGESVNKFNALTVTELGQAVDSVKKESGLKGLLLSSQKDVFVVGADITEFLGLFETTDEELSVWLEKTHGVFNAIEDLPFPTVTAINGIALGGGFEVCLTTAFRIASPKAVVGLPETKLGIYPGWGGTIRLPRLIGADNAIEWIAGGSNNKAPAALAMGAVDGVVEPEKLRQTCLNLLKDAGNGKFDWKARTAEKTSPMTLRSPMEGMMVFEGAKGFVKAKAGPHYPAPVEAIKAMQMGAALPRDKAIPHEIKGFVKVAKTPVAQALVTIFLSDQFNKKKSKKISQQANPPKRAAVLGAGIMGGGIAYQSASKGTPILMKDINTKALDLGMSEAVKLLSKQVKRGKINEKQMAQVVSAISPTLSYGDFSDVDYVVEAVVENPKIKKSVLADLEENVSKDTILTSNTSTISITELASDLKRPENFCGMHFFNPVHRMPLVEIIRGEKTSDKAIGAAVAYSLKMGKTPIVVNDCPGFLVNRILFPYFAGLNTLINDGVDFLRIDKVMEKFGWPMGPCYLLDVVGMDTAVHAAAVMSQGFPDRMGVPDKSATNLMVDAGRLGQKSGKGFYSYELDKKGKPKKKVDQAAFDVVKPLVKKEKQVSDEDIINRMMVPMINEGSRCLEEKIVDTPMEVDLGLIYGLGFPPFRGGALKYADSIGLSAFCEVAASLVEYGKVYEPAPLIQEYAKSGKTFYQM